MARIDILINNAAICGLYLVEDATDAEVQQEVSVNLLGPLYAIRAVTPHLRSIGGGDIINVSSESVRMPYPYLSLYAATKAGLEVLSAGLRAELRRDGIRVTVLRSSGIAESTMNRAWRPDRAQAFYKMTGETGHIAATGGFVTPETMALAVLGILALPREINIDLLEARKL